VVAARLSFRLFGCCLTLGDGQGCRESARDVPPKLLYVDSKFVVSARTSASSAKTGFPYERDNQTDFIGGKGDQDQAHQSTLMLA
jgi:hypothetical protein